MRLPDDFDEALYLAMHPDVRLARVDAKEHFLAHGFKEGRAYKLKQHPCSRNEFLARLYQYSSILEIGPFDCPVAPNYLPTTAEVAFADWLSTVELKSRARSIQGRNPDGVPHISYIAKGKLADVIVQKFDCVVSSHMIEHTPDLIAHLNDVRSLLKPGGAYLLLCPDKQQCFDHFLPESSLPEVVTAFLEQRTRPTLRSVVEHRAFTRHDFPTSSDPLKTPNENDWATILRAKHEFESNAYVDVHCWQFTATSLRELIQAISSLGLLARPSRCETHQLGGEIGGLIQW